MKLEVCPEMIVKLIVSYNKLAHVNINVKARNLTLTPAPYFIDVATRMRARQATVHPEARAQFKLSFYVTTRMRAR